MWKFMYFIVVFKGFGLVFCQFIECHDDPGYEPDEGSLSEMQFTWLGALQYIHVKNGTPHYFRVPRVVLINRQFVLSTAVDAAQVPKGYALGNVAFGEYERDEEECGITPEMLAAGVMCEAAVLLVPLSDVLLHPEYKHFGVMDSIALLKLITPIRSNYMLPACLPFKNFIFESSGVNTEEIIWHVDFISEVPRDYFEEEKEVSRINVLPKELCFLYETSNMTISSDIVDIEQNTTTLPQKKIMCTSGCDFHSGAPSFIHEHTGHWSIVAIAQGGFPCPDPLRSRRPPSPPRHILLYPYVPWITAAISGKAVGSFAKDDPFGFIMPRSFGVNDDYPKKGWVGHWWLGGMRCFDRSEATQDMFKFYHEIFIIDPPKNSYLTYFLEIHAAYESVIVCVKVGMPYRLGGPKVWDLDTTTIKLRIPVFKLHVDQFKFHVEAWARNFTVSSESTGSKSCAGSQCTSGDKG